MQLAVMRAVARLRAHVIPCFRFHSDRAREFLGDALERFLAEQGIFSTRTAPEDHAANGSSEVAIRELKRSARKALLESNLDSSHWPTAIRHVGEVAWRRGISRLGGSARPLLSYGTPVEARKRLRHRDVWTSRTRSGVLVGPAPQTPSSYLVLFEDLPSADAEPPLRPKPLSGQSTGVFQATPHYRRSSKSPAVRVTLQGPSLPAAEGMSALADFSDFSNVSGRAEESLESEAESLDFLQDPQQESPAFQEVRMASVEESSDSEVSATLGGPGETHPQDSSDAFDEGLRAPGEHELGAKVAKFVGPNPQRLPEPRPRPNRRRTALLYVSFGYFEPEQRRALCTLQEKEFERQLADFVQMLDPSDAVNDDLQGQPEPLLEVLQHHDDDYSMYEEGMQFPDRLLVFTIWNFRLGRTQVVLLRITEARDEQPAEPVLRVPGPEPPAVMKLRIKGFRSSGAQGSGSASSSQPSSSSGFSSGSLMDAASGSMIASSSGNASTTATLSTEESTIVAWRIDPPSFPLCQALYSDAPLGPFLVQAGLQGCQQVVDNDDDFEKTLHYAIRGYADFKRGEQVIPNGVSSRIGWVVIGAIISERLREGTAVELEGGCHIPAGISRGTTTSGAAPVVQAAPSMYDAWLAAPGSTLNSAKAPAVLGSQEYHQAPRPSQQLPSSSGAGYGPLPTPSQPPLPPSDAFPHEAASSVDPSPPEEDTESTLPHPRIRKVDHSDRADVNAPVARWERHYAVLTDEEAREWQAGNPAEPTTGWNPLDVQNFGSLTHSIHRPELSFPVSRMAQLTTKRPKDALGIGQGVLRFLKAFPAQCIVYGPPPGDCGPSTPGQSWKPLFMPSPMRLLGPAPVALIKGSLCVGLELPFIGNQGVRLSPRFPLQRAS